VTSPAGTPLRHTVDTLTSDALDQLYDERGRLEIANRALNTATLEALERAEQAEAALARVRRLAERWRYTGDRKEGPLRELRTVLDEPAPGPAATQATEEH
jgi:hypothetical protein